MDDLNLSAFDEDSIMKEVWNPENIDVKTELTSGQIKDVNRALTYAKLFDDPVLESHVFQFLRLQKSKDRKSMEEFIKALTAKGQNLVDRARQSMGGLLG